MDRWWWCLSVLFCHPVKVKTCVLFPSTVQMVLAVIKENSDMCGCGCNRHSWGLSFLFERGRVSICEHWMTMKKKKWYLVSYLASWTVARGVRGKVKGSCHRKGLCECCLGWNVWQSTGKRFTALAQAIARPLANTLRWWSPWHKYWC